VVKTKRKIESNGHVQPVEVAPAQLLKLDFGSGPNPREGFEGVDRFPFDGKVKHVLDLRQTPWPWPDCSVEEAHCSHFLEHLTNLDGKWERVKFFNELHRVLVPGGKCQVIIPYWCSQRYYGDPTHKEPFSEMGWLYLIREWRLGNPAKGVGPNAPHADVTHNPDGYSCDFETTYGFSLHPEIALRSQPQQQFAMQFYKESCLDMLATLTKRA
jgi:hypothetical protein